MSTGTSIVLVQVIQNNVGKYKKLLNSPIQFSTAEDMN